MSDKSSTAYWRANVSTILTCLVVWFLCSFGAGILFRPMLSGVMIGGADLGFWFAQQGAILVFIVLIFAYSARMNRLDHEFGVDE